MVWFAGLGWPRPAKKTRRRTIKGAAALARACDAMHAHADDCAFPALRVVSADGADRALRLHCPRGGGDDFVELGVFGARLLFVRTSDAQLWVCDDGLALFDHLRVHLYSNTDHEPPHGHFTDLRRDATRLELRVVLRSLLRPAAADPFFRAAAVFHGVPMGPFRSEWVVMPAAAAAAKRPRSEKKK